jgi:hypothetical protein
MSQKIDNKLRGNALWAGLSAESMKKGAESQHLLIINELQ